MKNSRLKTSVALAALTLTSALAVSAADTDKPQRPSREEILQQFDANGDGQLDQTEREAVRAHMQANRPGGAGRGQGAQGARGGRGGPGGPGGPGAIAQFDTDGDGQLSEAERTAAEPAIRAHMASNERAMKRFDTDGDGNLSDAEFAQAREAMKDGGGRARGQGGKGGKRSRDGSN